MSDVVIKVENLSKQYRLGEVGTGTISNDLNRWWAKLRGKEDPFTKIGEVNDRTKKGSSDYVWALKDINFEVKQGEVLGIIGRNGAGKSTLLKLLSKVTQPTTGSIKTKGRIASLLEVGTGFHPELTGRENIFLNGAILGMTKREIKSKFDEIVDFAGVERYIDTPVKRYSSGMYVRLAFAVAAHLEPEILIIDEVLAVGDAEFQKKCLGKMDEVSHKDGRTILFVSHNMSSILSLCNSAIYMVNGGVRYIGDADSTVAQYLHRYSDAINNFFHNLDLNDGIVNFSSIQIIDRNYNLPKVLSVKHKVGIKFNFEVLVEGYNPQPCFLLSSYDGTKLFQAINTNDFTKVGKYEEIVWIPENFLNDHQYILTCAITTPNPVKVHFSVEIPLNILDSTSSDTRGDYKGKMHGYLRPLFDWEQIKLCK